MLEMAPGVTVRAVLGAVIHVLNELLITLVTLVVPVIFEPVEGFMFHCTGKELMLQWLAAGVPPPAGIVSSDKNEYPGVTTTSIEAASKSGSNRLTSFNFERRIIAPPSERAIPALPASCQFRGKGTLRENQFDRQRLQVPHC